MRKYIYGSLTLVCMLAYGCIDLEKFAQKNLYPVDKVNKTEVPDPPPEGYQSLNLDGPDGRIHAYYYENANPRAPLLIYYHGNGTNLGTFAKGNILAAFKNLGAHVMIHDHPGYGNSEGIPSELSLIPAATQIFDWSKSKFSRASKTVVWGRSLGCAVAAQVVANRQNKVNSFVLTSPWNNLENLMRHHFGDRVDDLSIEWTDKNKYQTDLHAERTNTTGYIFHGDKDTVVPFEQGEELATHYSNVTFVPMPDYEHNDVFKDRGMWDLVRSLLN